MRPGEGSGPILRNKPEKIEVAQVDGEGNRIWIDGPDDESYPATETISFRFVNRVASAALDHFGGADGFSQAFADFDQLYRSARMIFCLAYGWSEAEADERLLEGELQVYVTAILVAWARYCGVSEAAVSQVKADAQAELARAEGEVMASPPSTPTSTGTGTQSPPPGSERPKAPVALVSSGTT